MDVQKITYKMDKMTVSRLLESHPPPATNTQTCKKIVFGDKSPGSVTVPVFPPVFCLLHIC